MLKSILQGTDTASRQRLQEVLAQTSDSPENILWYPSAGNDYRDLLELHPQCAAAANIQELPDFYVHTDYHTKSVDLAPGKLIHTDGHTQVLLKNVYQLALRPGLDVHYQVNPAYADFSEEAPLTPTIYLLDIRITSDQFGTFERPVFYFLFENYNFLEEIVLKQQLRITHFVKVCEGCAWGGNRKSISAAYGLLSAMQTRYLLIDERAPVDFKLWQQITQRHAITPLAYTLRQLMSRGDWSGYSVRIFEVQPKLTEPLNEDGFKSILRRIAP